MSGVFARKYKGEVAAPTKSAGEYFPEDATMLVKIMAVDITPRKEAFRIKGKIVQMIEGPEGREGHVCYQVMPPNAMQFQNAAAFVCAAHGDDPSDADTIAEYTADAIDDAASGNWDQLGQTVLLRTRLITTKAGNPFTVHSWKPDPNAE